MARQNLGFVTTWDEVFQKARQLLDTKAINAIAFVSLSEFSRGCYAETPIRGLAGAPATTRLGNIPERASWLYQGERFHLSTEEKDYRHPLQHEGSMKVLTVVYLKVGEEIPDEVVDTK